MHSIESFEPSAVDDVGLVTEESLLADPLLEEHRQALQRLFQTNIDSVHEVIRQSLEDMITQMAVYAFDAETGAVRDLQEVEQAPRAANGAANHSFNDKAQEAKDFLIPPSWADIERRKSDLTEVSSAELHSRFSQQTATPRLAYRAPPSPITKVMPPKSEGESLVVEDYDSDHEDIKHASSSKKAIRGGSSNQSRTKFFSKQPNGMSRQLTPSNETLPHEVGKLRKSMASGGRIKEKRGPMRQGAVFADAAAMKEKVREAVGKKEYRVTDYYWDEGTAQMIARSQAFDNLTLLIIGINALWLAVDTDMNPATFLLDADPVFIIAENCFCFYFSWEWVIRFASFRHKKDCLRDAWFCFDSGLVVMMVIETWLMTLIALIVIGPQGSGSVGGSGSGVLKLVRLVRLTRMARMARLLRAVPELVILIKGIGVASRSVLFTLCLLVLIMYIFAIVFKQLVPQLSDDDYLEQTYFPSVAGSMSSLLLDGVLPDMAQVVRDCADENYILGALILLFILLASLTVMNMLVGVLCEVVGVVSSVEKEQLTVTYVKHKLQTLFTEGGLDDDGNSHISKEEFESLLVRPETARVIQEIGVDVIGLVDFSEYIFQDGIELSFADFMELVLQLRGTNNSTVKDIVDLRRYIMQQFDHFSGKVSHQLASSLRPIAQPRSKRPSIRFIQQAARTAPCGFFNDRMTIGEAADRSPAKTAQNGSPKSQPWVASCDQAWAELGDVDHARPSAPRVRPVTAADPRPVVMVTGLNGEQTPLRMAATPDNRRPLTEGSPRFRLQPPVPPPFSATMWDNEEV